jgi:hypothetical protein
MLHTHRLRLHSWRRTTCIIWAFTCYLRVLPSFVESVDILTSFSSNYYQVYDSPVTHAAPLAYVAIVYVASLQTVRGALTDPTYDGGLV